MVVSNDTVDGSEIPNNHLGWLKTLINNGIIIILGGFLDFVHQQYVLLSPLFGEDSPILTNINIFQSG